MTDRTDRQLPLGLETLGPQVFEYEPVQEVADSKGMYDRCKVIHALLEMPANGKLDLKPGSQSFPTVTTTYQRREVALQLSVDDAGTYILANPAVAVTNGVAIREGQVSQLAGEDLGADELEKTTRSLLGAYAREVGIPNQLLKRNSTILDIMEARGSDSTSRLKRIAQGVATVTSRLSQLFVVRENTFLTMDSEGDYRYSTIGKPTPEDIREQISNRRILERSRLKFRLAGPLLLSLMIPNPFNIGDRAETAGVSYPQPLILNLADEIINHSEHQREDFDRRGIDLPDAATTVPFGVGRVEIATMATSIPIPEGIGDAPVVDAGSREKNAADNNYSVANRSNQYQFGFVQDVYGGPRRVTEIHEARDDDILPPGECGTVDANVNPGDSVKAVDLGGNWLSVAVDGDIHICNAGTVGIPKSQLGNVYIQVIEQSESS